MSVFDESVSALDLESLLDCFRQKININVLDDEIDDASATGDRVRAPGAVMRQGVGRV
jgi:hypothetical protein